MASDTIDYYFTVTSPWSYLGHEPILALAAKHNRKINFKPVDFGTVFAQSGGLPLPKRAPQRRRYRMFELQRWRDYRGTELNLRPKFFPTDAELANRMAMVAGDSGQDAGALTLALMRGCWVDEVNVGERAICVEIANRAGLDGEALATAAQSAAGDARAAELTQDAIDAQVFGAPTYVIAGEPFWGQDRLELVARALEGKAGPYRVEGPV